MQTIEKYRIFWQLILWWGIWHIGTFFLTNGYDHPGQFALRAIISFIPFFIVVYINSRYLLPELLFQNKIFLFILCGILLVALAAIFLHGDIFPWSEWFSDNPSERMPRPGRKGPPPAFKWMGMLTPFVIAFLGSTLLEIFQLANKKDKELIQVEKEKLNTELKFLKSQVNPHFLFNALNNIYSLAVTQSPRTPESVMQLSEILRYMVYDSKEDKVLLKNEISYIKNFVELKLMKDSRGMDVELEIEPSNDNLMIAPLLLIPYVENAFKHSRIEDIENGHIKIKLKSDNDSLEFQVINSIPETNYTKDEVGGVGLENTKKRLELLYPNKMHDLIINQGADQYEVILKLSAK